MSDFDDRHVMRRALALAAKGYGVVHPNPLVGCVIVKNGSVVAEGWHRRFGGAHAEVEALRKAGEKARGSTVYVNLEPCSHHGKTPPCARAIIDAGVREVVVAVKDPHALVSGRGIAMLRSAGISVRLGAARSEAELLNERFLTFHRTGRPFVGLKWAQTIDGRAVDQRGRSKWITGPEARREVHRLRAGYDAVLVGAHTVALDDPRLTVRAVNGRDPVRVVVDRRFQVTGREQIFDGSVRTILVTHRSQVTGGNRVVRRLIERGVEVLGLAGDDTFAPSQILAALAGEGITSLLVEGGPATMAAFVAALAFDKVHAFVGPMVFGGGRAGIELRKPFGLSKPLRLHRVTGKAFDDGTVLIVGYRGEA